MMSEIHNTDAKKTELLTYPTVELLAEEDAAPLLSSKNPIPNSYLIMLKDNISENKFEIHKKWLEYLISQSEFSLTTPEQTSKLSTENGGGIKHVYNFGGIIGGYSGKFAPEVVKTLLRHPDVHSIQRDFFLSVS
ncbi:unnamed protein product [Ambrosiozyma monospora]|uniref:Unnamed protein product n=1 Tax=Ambrosiozyma monospora TaxID=43982 RepID=A0ACB5U6R1_AMBMO|nr:unnamed protein product [Ambrosiozyma monospora]